MTSDLERCLDHMAGCLADQLRTWALVGGLAVALRANPRLTRDVDVAVSVADDVDAESVVLAMVQAGYGVAAVVEHDPSGRLATVRLAHPDWTGTLTDILFASSGIEPEVASQAQVLAAPSALEVPVARIGHLMAMKVLAQDDRRRPTDADDLRALVEVADADEWDLAQRSVDQITERGFARGRDLRGALRSLRPSD
ncbi:MAG: nucleotidyl transferase AbiEii/AbiGii toxin family protein [Iamia sp.]